MQFIGCDREKESQVNIPYHIYVQPFLDLFADGPVLNVVKGFVHKLNINNKKKCNT